MLLEYGADPMLRDCNGETILHVASKNNDTALIKELVKRKVDLDVKDQLGKAPLHHASERGYEQSVAALLEGGCSAKVVNNWDALPLHYTCLNGHLHAALKLLKAALRDPPEGLFMQVLRHNKCKLFEDNFEVITLLKESCGVDDVDKSGETPLFKACYRGHLKIVRALLERGASAMIKVGGVFPLDLIKQGRERELIERLAAKVSRLVARIKLDFNIGMDDVDPMEQQISVKRKKITEVFEYSSYADKIAFHKMAVVNPVNFEINIRDVSNKLRLLSLKRIHHLNEAKQLCKDPYQYHLDLRRRVIKCIKSGYDAYIKYEYREVHDQWELATQLQIVKDWVATSMLRDKPINKEESDRLYDVYRLFCIYQSYKEISHVQFLELRSRAEILIRLFDETKLRHVAKTKKRKKKKKKNDDGGP